MRPGLLAVLSVGAMFAQTPSARPAFDAFEVATIKPAFDTPGRYIRMQSVNRFYAKGFTLKALVAAAFSLAPGAISGGAAWTDADRFDILASTPGAVQPNQEEQMAMLRKLIVDRFQLAFHREPRELPVYSLSVAKGGAKLRQSAAPTGTLPELINVIHPDEKGGVYIQLPARNATMAQLAAMMQRSIFERPVVDNTGLSGTYDFDLEWAPDDGQFGGQLPKSSESGKASLFAAMQEQIGLRLEATRGQVAALVIDRAERPSEN